MNQTEQNEFKKFLPQIIFEEYNSVQLTKAFGNSNRIKILSYLLFENKDFNFLLKSLNLKKTALSNHLVLLKDCNLIEKNKKGKYSLSLNGYNFIKSFIIASTLNSVLEGKMTLDSYQAVKEIFSNHKMESNFVYPRPRISNNRLSLLASVSGVLEFLDINFSTAEVGGYSGYVFRINVGKDSTHVSGPTAGPFWDDIYHGFELMTKRKLKVNFIPGSIFPYDQLTEEEETKLNNLFDEIKFQINHNNPVILWGIHAPEFGLVIGYSGNSIIASTFKNIDDKIFKPIRLSNLISPSGLWYIFFDESLNIEITTKELDKKALENAVKMIKGTNISVKDEAWELNNNQWTGKELNYITGLQAFDVWAENLVNDNNEHYNYEGNSYCGFCYSESLRLAHAFLETLAKRYIYEPFSDTLQQASVHYKNAFYQMEKFESLFPWDNERLVTMNERQRGVQLLIKSKAEIKLALGFIQESIEKFTL